LEEITSQVIEHLGYQDPANLVATESPNLPYSRLQVWREAHHRIGVDAAYFLNDVPVVYFKGLVSHDSNELYQLHRRLWNHGRAPLLITVSPESVHVFNCFNQPPRANRTRANDDHVLFSGKMSSQSLKNDPSFQIFSLSNIVSGRLHQTRNVNTESRVDRRLLANIRHLRRQLTDHGVSLESANSVIGASLFVSWIQDRGLLQFIQLDDSSSTLSDALLRGKASVANFFGSLSEQLNGDFARDPEALVASLS
jgi:hypothetical protein